MHAIKLLTAGILLLMSATGIAEETSDIKVNALAARMQQIEQALNNNALLDMAKRMAALQREVRELRGENERLVYELNSIKTLQREQYMDIDRRLQSLSATAITTAPAATTVPAGTTTAAGTGTTGSPEGSASDLTASTAISTAPATVPQDISTTAVPDASSIPAPSEPVATATIGQVVSPEAAIDAARDYKNAFTLLKGGKYDDSIAAFESFLQRHPDSKYAANAQYWLAEANYVSRRYPRALVEFSTVVNKYPASSKLADARLKLGFTHYELGQYQEARDELTRLRAQFPNSSVASLAQQRLERMSREGN